MLLCKGKRVLVVETAENERVYALFEKTVPKRRPQPREDREWWTFLASGCAQDMVSFIFERAALKTTTGILRDSRGHYLLEESYIAAWLNELAMPFRPAPWIFEWCFQEAHAKHNALQHSAYEITSYDELSFLEDAQNRSPELGYRLPKTPKSWSFATPRMYAMGLSTSSWERLYAYKGEEGGFWFGQYPELMRGVLMNLSRSADAAKFKTILPILRQARVKAGGLPGHLKICINLMQAPEDDPSYLYLRRLLDANGYEGVNYVEVGAHLIPPPLEDQKTGHPNNWILSAVRVLTEDLMQQSKVGHLMVTLKSEGYDYLHLFKSMPVQDEALAF